MSRGSPYIEWSKGTGRIQFNLATSGVLPCPLERLDPRPEDLAISAPNSDGWSPLLEKLARRHRLDPSRIALAHGTAMANHLVCATLLQPGDHVLVEQPGFEPLRLVPSYLGAEVQGFPRLEEDRFAVDPDQIRKRLTPRTRLVILTNLHNPSGVATRWETLAELGALAERHGFHVLVDEVFYEFLGDRDRTAAHLSTQFVATRGLTKAYGLDGLRAAWIMGSRETIAAVLRTNNLFSMTTAHPTERLMARALDRADQIRRPVEEYLAKNRAILERFLEGRSELRWTPSTMAPIFWITPRGIVVDDLVELLQQRFDTTVAPGRFFGDPSRFRLGIGTTSKILSGGLQRLGEALEEMPATPFPPTGTVASPD